MVQLCLMRYNMSGFTQTKWYYYLRVVTYKRVDCIYASSKKLCEETFHEKDLIWDSPVAKGMSARISHPQSVAALLLHTSTGTFSLALCRQSNLMPSIATLAAGHFWYLQIVHCWLPLLKQFPSGNVCLKRIWYTLSNFSRFTKAALQNISPWAPFMLHPEKMGQWCI